MASSEDGENVQLFNFPLFPQPALFASFTKSISYFNQFLWRKVNKLHT